LDFKSDTCSQIKTKALPFAKIDQVDLKILIPAAPTILTRSEIFFDSFFYIISSTLQKTAHQCKKVISSAKNSKKTVNV